MRIIQKILYLAGLLAIGLCLLSGCGNQDSTGDQSGNTAGSSNNSAKNSAVNDYVTVGDIKIAVVTEGLGLYKVDNEYIYKGRDYNDDDRIVNNIVKFGDNYWRILKINEDKTIKLMYFGYIDERAARIANEKTIRMNHDLLSRFFDKDNNFKDKIKDLSYETSYMRKYLNEEFLNTNVLPDDYEDYLVKKEWDITKYTSEELALENIGSVSREYSSFKDYVGLISVKDYWDTAFNGADKRESNYMDDMLNRYFEVKNIITSNFELNENRENLGLVDIESGGMFKPFNLRIKSFDSINHINPVVNLKETVKLSSGTGTLEDPYIVSK